MALCLSRQSLPVLDETATRRPPVERGAYVLYEPDRSPDALLLATGSEVHVARAAATQLADEGVAARVVSMPSWELFESQPVDYQHQVLPPSIAARVAVEAASPLGWCRWTGIGGEVVALDRFGASAPGERVLAELGFTPENVKARTLDVLRRAGAARGP